MAATTKIIVRSDGVQLKQTVDKGHVTSTSYMGPGGQWMPGRPQAAPGTTWTEANGDKASVGHDGNVIVDAAPHGLMDQIAHYAPYGLAAAGGYGALSDAGVFGGAGSAATTAGGAAPSAATAGATTAGLTAAELEEMGIAAPAATSAATSAATTAGTTAATTGGFWHSLGHGLKKIFGGGGNPLALAGVGAGTDLLGAYFASRAANKAAEIQAQAAQNALDFERHRYEDAQANFKPFIEHGQTANTTLADALMPKDGPAPTADNLAGRWIAPFQQAARYNGRTMVQMKGPSGETHPVPDFMVPSYLAKGAQVVS